MPKTDLYSPVIQGSKASRVILTIWAAGMFLAGVLCLTPFVEGGPWILMSLVFIGYAGFLLRLVTCKLEIRSDGVSVRNPYRNHFVDWEHFDRFSVERWGWLKPNALHVRTTDGRKIPVFGGEGRGLGFPGERERALARAARLQRIADERGAEPRPRVP
jgi:hypothetical protein